ncbi:hypothetical protein MRX96_024069 [Rhipicephalus microplus]
MYVTRSPGDVVNSAYMGLKISREVIGVPLAEQAARVLSLLVLEDDVEVVLPLLRGTTVQLTERAPRRRAPCLT